MSFFQNIANAIKTSLPQVFHSATAQVIAIQDSAPNASGPDKHTFVLDGLKTRFAPQLAELGDLANNALDIIVRAAFAEARSLVPAIFAPVVDTVEKAVETKLSESPFTAAPAPLGKPQSVVSAIIGTQPKLTPKAP